jgi:hypothetical protein
VFEEALVVVVADVVVAETFEDAFVVVIVAVLVVVHVGVVDVAVSVTKNQPTNIKKSTF